jgi:uncharacterized protein DUF1580
MQSETYLDLSEAARRSPGRPHSATVWRWCRKGIKARSGGRIRLDHVRAGGKIFIQPEALDRFFKDVARADDEYFADEPTPPKQPSTRTERQRERSVARAECVLKLGGIL